MGKLKDRYIRFDWAIKRLLRDKANFAVLEGLLTVLFEDKTQIVEILESEGNQLAETDKFNRVDIKAKNSKGEIILVEVQNTREVYYLERILYGVAKTITEHISLGESYGNIHQHPLLYLVNGLSPADRRSFLLPHSPPQIRLPAPDNRDMPKVRAGSPIREKFSLFLSLAKDSSHLKAA